MFALMARGGGILVARAERLIGVVFIPVGTSRMLNYMPTILSNNDEREKVKITVVS